MNNFQQYLQEVLGPPRVRWRLIHSDVHEVLSIYKYTCVINTRTFEIIVARENLYGAVYSVSVDFHVKGQYVPTGLNQDQFQIYSVVGDILSTMKEEDKIGTGDVVMFIGVTDKQDLVYKKIKDWGVKKGFLKKEGHKYLIR